MKIIKIVRKLGIVLLALGCAVLLAFGGQSRSRTSFAAARQAAPSTTHKVASDHCSILNDGTTDANASLVFKDGPKSAPEKTAWLVISRGDPRKPRVVYAKELGGGNGGRLEIGHFSGGDEQEIFVFVDGQKTEAAMLRCKGNRASVLYRLEQGRPIVILRYRDTKDGQIADIVEEWPTFQLALNETPGFKGHPVALKVFRWNGRRYQQHHIEPADKWVEGKAYRWPSTELNREVG